MTAATAVARGQAAAQALMVDSCTITRGGTRTFNTTTGAYTTTGGSTVYTGKCRVKPSNLSANTTAQAGERQVSLWPYTVSIPASEDADLNDVVTVTASADASLVGRTLRIRAVTRGTNITARRLDVEEVGDG